MNKLTAIVISFYRPRYTIDCVKSLRKQYPKINILVGENGKVDDNIAKAVSEVGGRYIQLPFDSGVGGSRNRIISEVETEYVLIGDDDFLYDKEAKVDKMLKFLKSNKKFDIVGGRIFEDKKIKNYQGNFDIQDDHIVYSSVNENEVKTKNRASGLRYKKVDITFNYFVSRVKDILPWDENIKVAYEHSHWFINAKKVGKRVAFVPDAIVKHKFQNYPINKDYIKYRNRKSDKHYFFKSLGIKYVKGFNGDIDRINPDGGRKYFAKKMVIIKGRLRNVGDVVIIKDEEYNRLPKGIKEKIIYS